MDLSNIPDFIAAIFWFGVLGVWLWFGVSIYRALFHTIVEREKGRCFDLGIEYKVRVPWLAKFVMWKWD